MCERFSHVLFGDAARRDNGSGPSRELTASASTEHAEVTQWELEERASVCRCQAVPTEHYHCLCTMCQGKPVSRKTAYRHSMQQQLPRRQVADQQLQPDFTPTSQTASSVSREVNEMEISHESDSDTSEADETAIMNEDVEVDPGTKWSDLHGDIMEALLDLLELKDKQNLSINCFEAILRWGKQLFCKNDPNLAALFPTTWQECQRVLKDRGFNDCQVYYICLNSDHQCHYCIMNSAEEKCKFCNEPGSIKYYYLGLKDRVVQWSGKREMCQKLTAHWRDRENWIGEENSVNWGRMVKKEIWDGTRFAELAYFWDPNKVWITSCFLSMLYIIVYFVCLVL